MKRVQPRSDWPESWAYSYAYDLEEIYGEHKNLGYAYAYQNRRVLTLDLLREVLSPGSTVLDIAAAQGNFSLTMAEAGYDVTWNDLRADLVGYVQAKHERGTVHFAPGNAFELEFPHRFDAVLITEVIEHTAHPDRFLANAAKLAKPGGYVIMTTPNGQYFRHKLPKFSECSDPSVFEAVEFRPDADGHIFFLHTSEVRDFARQIGLTVEKVVTFNNSLTSGHVKLAKLLNVLPARLVERVERASRKLPERLALKLLSQMAVRFRVPPVG